MANIWNCPNCGDSISSSTKCPSCGSELIPSNNNSVVKLKSEVPCPHCGYIIEKSSWFCVNCLTVLTAELTQLKDLHKRANFEQERVKSQFLPRWMVEKFEKNEVTLFCFGKINHNLNNFYLITNYKLVKNVNGVYQEVKLEDISSIGMFQVTRGFLSVGSQFTVVTYSGDIKFDFKVGEVQECVTLRSRIQQSLDNHRSGKKYAKMKIIDVFEAPQNQTILFNQIIENEGSQKTEINNDVQEVVIDETTKSHNEPINQDIEKMQISGNQQSEDKENLMIRAKEMKEHGNAFYKKGQYEEALTMYNGAISLYPDYADLWNNKGMVLTKLGRFTEAKECKDRYDRLVDI